MEKKQKNKESKGKFSFPAPQPGKYSSKIDCSFKMETSDSVNRQIEIRTIPRIAGLLRTIGMDELATIVVEDEKKDVDVPSKHIMFTGEIAIAVAAAKSEDGPLAKNISKLKCPVPEPLFDIADSIGNFIDPVSRYQNITNVNDLLVEHLIGASVCVDTFSSIEDVETSIEEASRYVSYPTEQPEFLIPKVYLDSQFCVNAMKRAVRVTTPTFQVRKSQSEIWTDSFKKYLKQNQDASFMSWIQNIRVKPEETQKNMYFRNLSQLCVSITQDQQPRVARFAENICSDKFYGALGILEIPTLLSVIKTQIKACKITIERQLSAVFKIKNTKDITKFGSLASATTLDDVGNLRAPYEMNDFDRDIAFVAKFKQKDGPKQVCYQSKETWNSYSTKWLKCYIHREENT